MKYLFHIGGLNNSGGSERVMSILINQAVTNGDEVVIVTRNDGLKYNISAKAKHIVVGTGLPQNRLLRTLGYLRRLRNVVKKERPNIIISFLTTDNINICLATIGLRCKIVVSERNTPSMTTLSKKGQMFRNMVYALSDGFVFQTEEAREEFPKYISQKSIVIPNPVKDGLPVSDRNCIKDYIVAVGRLHPQKNYPLLIEAFKDFSKKYNTYKLKIYGTGSEKDKLITLISDLGLADKIKLMGVSDNLHEEIKDASMYVLSSDYEGISNALLESLCVGLPCISTDCPCGGSKMLIENGINGMLVPVADKKALTMAMMKIAESSDFSARLSKEAQKCRIQYSSQTILEKYFNFFHSICLS